MILHNNMTSQGVTTIFATERKWRKSLINSQAAAISLTLAVVAAVTYTYMPAETLTAIRRWHGSIDDQFDNVDNLVNTHGNNLQTWSVPQQLYATLLNNRDNLDTLIPKCRSTQGSTADRAGETPAKP
jgi:hypothetical protein